jgi:hypothetical protein
MQTPPHTSYNTIEDRQVKRSNLGITGIWLARITTEDKGRAE